MAESIDVDDPGRALTEEELKGLQKHLSGLRDLFQQLSLTTSIALVDLLKREPPKSRGEMRVLHTAFHAEMKDRVVLYIPSHLRKHYDREALTERGRKAFPKANQELVEAGNAAAYGMATACVFHSVRALEFGLGALANNLNVPTAGTDNWQNVIEQIEKSIKSRGDSLPKGNAKSEEMQFLSEAASEFRHFKDAWRNYVSHNKVTYTESQALKVMEHVDSFIESLSTRLKEAP